VLHFAFGVGAPAQETPPAPGAPRSVQIPAVQERKLPNGMTVAVVERRNVPLVTVQLVVRSGASGEGMEKAGLANLTAALLTKGTKTRTATQIAEEMEFLGGSINTSAGWNSSSVVVTAMSNRIDPAMAIMADAVLNPTFKQEELDLLKSQTLDNLTYNLKQPGFLANYVASRYSFREHPSGGTPASLKAISREDITGFHSGGYKSDSAVLIFAGDITAAQAEALARKYFGGWANKSGGVKRSDGFGITRKTESPLLKRILVVDLPNSGQAAVNYTKDVTGAYRFNNTNYYPASVLNSLLGGGYSSRLNQEIRIRRGLSYGAGSSFAWRLEKSNFGTRTQTKNESAAIVAELVLAEIKRLTEGSIEVSELTPRKSVLTGNFGRNLETTAGLAAQLAELYNFGLPANVLNAYMNDVQSVTDRQIRDFAGANLMGGDLIIVGDYKVFKDDLAKRFPNLKIEVVKADELDLSRENLRK
ncbi:MAG TPA: pitrilysin family protein, partial [Pyrinomonadaceae bacterium]|nr:pitrilysin family protein [Pyrinomonadaceae bacterium]